VSMMLYFMLIWSSGRCSTVDTDIQNVWLNQQRNVWLSSINNVTHLYNLDDVVCGK